MIFKFFILYFLTLQSLINTLESDLPRKNEVKDLFDNYKGKIYTGYLKTESAENELFYLLSQSENNYQKDPLILWLEGGPGCSSLLGFLDKIGPIVTNEYSGKFIKNEFTWNKNASLLFIDSPFEVGFSIYKSRKHHNDSSTALSLYHALKDFYEIFPDFKENDLFISGTSYSGIYIPYLVQQIKGIDNKEKNSINLKGFIIGNPYTSEKIEYDDSFVDTAYTHGLISLETYYEYLNICPHIDSIIDTLSNPNYTNNTNNHYVYQLNEESNEPIKYVTKQCNVYRKKIQETLYGINVFGIQKICPYSDNIQYNSNVFNDLNNAPFHQSENSFLKVFMRNLQKRKKIKINLKNQYQNKTNEELEKAISFINDSKLCKDDLFLEEFLNNETIKEKLGVNKSLNWKKCIDFDYKLGDATNFYKEHLNKLNNFKSWIYSGTEDLVSPTLGTIQWIGLEKFNISSKWDLWKYNNQIKGSFQNYTNGLNIYTLKGAGHNAVADKREEVKYLFDLFLKSDYPVKDNDNINPEKKSNWIYIVLGIISFLIVLFGVFLLFRWISRSRNKLNEETINEITNSGALTQ